MLKQETNGTTNPSNSNSLEAASDEPKSDISVKSDDNAGGDAEKCNEKGEEKTPNNQSNGNATGDKKGDYFAVFLRNIPFTATEDDVKKHFEKTCKVKKVTFFADYGKFRGRGTVELEDRDSYQEAKKMVGSLMGGRPLYVVPHKAMKKSAEEVVEKEKKIYKAIVRNIPLSVSVLEAKRHFYSAGLIKQFLITRKDTQEIRDSSKHDGTAILKVDNLDAFINIMRMDKSVLGGVPIRVEPWGEVEIQERGSPFKRSSEINREKRNKRRKKIRNEEEVRRTDFDTTLFVGNLPYVVNKEEIVNHFAQAGPVLDCKIPVIDTPKIKRPVAFVKMADKNSYEKGLKLLGSTISDCEIIVGAVLDDNWMSRWTFLDKPPEKEKEDYVAFVGHIPYPTTEESIRKHFADAGEILNIDIPVKNGRQRGMAYIKLGDQTAFEKALDMHHTTLNGKVIDVLDASRGENVYELPTDVKKRQRGRYYRHRKRGPELTWDALCRM